MPSDQDPRVLWYNPEGEVVVATKTNEKPHKGKVFAAVQAHADDIPFFCAGFCAKLIDEGYTCLLYTSPSPRDS